MRPRSRRIASWLLGACLVAGMAGLSAGTASAATTGVAASKAPHLLLIHGYTDSCAGAYGATTGGTSTINYLTSMGNWPSGDVTTVGYYKHDYGTGDGGDSNSGICGVDLNTASSGWVNDASGCATYAPASVLDPPTNWQGSTDDPIVHLACLFAWYIYDTYTVNGTPVEIVAHSMGGLVTRAALGGHQAGLAGFPPAPLYVPDVVSVATPEGGIDPVIYGAGIANGGDNQELEDMFPDGGSASTPDPIGNFMGTMGEGAFEKPQGQGGTHWALIGASVPSGPANETTFQGQTCPPTQFDPSWSLARDLSCADSSVNNLPGIDFQYPDGDGVVRAQSMMAMPADTKVLYGTVEDWSTTPQPPPAVADPATEYEHEPICEDLSQVPVVGTSADTNVCTAGPYYLTDNNTGTTKAFVCTSSCTDTQGFSDLGLGSPIPVPHSLPEIASQLIAPVTPTTPATDNMPTTVEAGGAEYVAYADQSTEGLVHVTMYSPRLNSPTSWSDPTSSTFIGSGPTIAASSGGVVVAWADNGTSTDSSGVKAQQGDLMVALLRPSGFACVTDLRTPMQGNGTPAGITPYTPNLTSEGQDGTGQLLLTWVDTQHHNMHITPLTVNASSSSSACGPFTVSADTTVNVTNNTSFNGPALAVSGYTGTSGSSGERYWLMWAGTDSGHHLNIAEFQSAIGPDGFGLSMITQATESTHATNTDLGAAFEPTPGTADGSGSVWMAYCGTNNQVYYQEFTSVSGGTETAEAQGSCTVTVFDGWYSGGTDISYQYSTGLMLLSWAASGSDQIKHGVL